jgi:NTP pyrophosphatase (non-canonical NTP hydrolase)/ribosomal protein L21E
MEQRIEVKGKTYELRERDDPTRGVCIECAFYKDEEGCEEADNSCLAGNNPVWKEVVQPVVEKEKEEVQQEVMKEFKIGQKVMVVNNSRARGLFLDSLIGKTFEVTETDGIAWSYTYNEDGIGLHVPVGACVLVEDGNFELTDDQPVLEPQPIVHSEMVADLKKPGQAIIDSLTAEKMDALHMAVGIAGEAGELLDAVKKYVVYNKAADIENIIEELGDLEFYMEGIRQNFGITRQQTIDANITKLGVRYAQGYSDKAAQERADKALEEKANLEQQQA